MGVPAQTPLAPAAGLAEVQRVRQFFPETWIWDEVVTGADGTASLPFTAPDSITTWDLRAVALSPEKGLGIAETSLRVFQPFFLQADLPYSAIRGEEFPVKVALYNYLDTPQTLTVEIESAPWFDLLDESAKTVTVAGNDIGGVEFKIRPATVGSQLVKITARSGEAADAVVKSLIVEPEGVAREAIENVVLSPGASRTVDLTLPQRVVPDSARAYVALTGSLLAQTIDGLDQLLQMPFGCGEQNMILFAPDAYILDYLKETGQAEARDPGQGRAAAHHRLPARAHLPARRRQLLRLRAERPGGQPLPHRLRAQDLRPGEGSHVRRRRRPRRGGRLDHQAPEARRLLRVGRVPGPPGPHGRGARQGRPDRLRGRGSPGGRPDGGRGQGPRLPCGPAGRHRRPVRPGPDDLRPRTRQEPARHRGPRQAHGRGHRGRGRPALARRRRRAPAARPVAYRRAARPHRRFGRSDAGRRHRGHRLRDVGPDRARRPHRRFPRGQVARGATEQPGRVRLDAGHGGGSPGPHHLLRPRLGRHRPHRDRTRRRRNHGGLDLARQLRRHADGRNPRGRARRDAGDGQRRGRAPGRAPLQPAQAGGGSARCSTSRWTTTPPRSPSTTW